MISLLDYERKNTKHLIVRVLSEQWPLSARRIYHRLKKEHRLTVSYQAVHAALREFLAQGVLSARDRQYFLSPSWVEKVSAFAEGITEAYTKENYITHPKEIQVLHFRSMHACWAFLLSKAETSFFGTTPRFYAQLGRLLAAPLPAQDLSIIRKFCKDNDVVILCKHHSPIDKLVANFLRKQGMRIYTGINCAEPSTTLIYRDAVIHVYVLYSKDELFKLDAHYASIKNLLKQDILTPIYQFIGRNIRVKLVITRDPDVLADVLRHTRKLIPSA